MKSVPGLEVIALDFEGVFVITTQCFNDERGYFTERYNKRRFEDAGLATNWIQDNFSTSRFGVIRGLHFQTDPAQKKLVTCMRGRIFDVLVDLRPNSVTRGRWLSIELDSTKPRWVLIPEGIAHGFQVLSEEGADVLYKVDHHWNSASEHTILWSDAQLKIVWPLAPTVVSDKDRNGTSLRHWL